MGSIGKVITNRVITSQGTTRLDTIKRASIEMDFRHFVIIGLVKTELAILVTSIQYGLRN